MLYSLLKPLLLQLDAEYAHDLTLKLLRKVSETPLHWLLRQRVAVKPVTCMGLNFKNPLGLAAGLDKNGDAIEAFGAMGFAFIEVGTVTPRAQDGQARPRLFRIKEAEAFINRLGFNNLGVDYLVERLKQSRYDGIIGVNIGKNADTPIEQAQDDYLHCLQKVYPYAGYVALNLSSPNTAALRSLQYGVALDNLLTAIKSQQTVLQQQHGRTVPIAIKIAPDLEVSEIIQIADTALRHQIDGMIATNSTLDRQLVRGLSHCNERGGLSGRPLQQRSTQIITLLAKELQGKMPIIGVGGIDSLTAAREKLQAGATLLQLYSSLIYHGPALVKHIIAHL